MRARARRRMRVRALRRAALTCAVVIAVDQITKHTLGTSVLPGQVRHVIPGVTFVYVRNTGIAFSVLAGGGALVYVVAAAALIALIGYLAARPTRVALWLPTGMLVGGAIGNVIDRVAGGAVIDFIKLPHWPVFNFADISITFGAIILALVVEFGRDAAPHV